MNVEHRTLNAEPRMIKPAVAEAMAGKKYQVNWERVDPKFCEANCNAWMPKTRKCGTIYTTVERKGMCMFENPRLTTKHAKGAKG